MYPDRQASGYKTGTGTGSLVTLAGNKQHLHFSPFVYMFVQPYLAQICSWLQFTFQCKFKGMKVVSRLKYY